ncbi:NAD-dependent protein deacylase [Rarobacter faecitabidus]|uniref:NAD-dependent protein deacetylase n=1 Tax=Rarobacter faecitabidus TaxID=13243 RepID=A0A542ZP06_RARFA|nr:NAD-dependent protein deacylase [Rarobacter faecitabidus]TQL62085.1 NAD-dependent deacetylase [Rarobacter faecitabidus]
MSEESSHDDARALRRIIERSRSIVFFGGAGVSTESGIPDFRSAAGLYKAQSEYGHRPETILSAEFFATEPETFFDYYFGNLVHPDAQPGPAHRALAALENRGQLASVVTQNIDGLHGLAGSRNVLELHGSGQRNHCLQCGRRFGLEAVMALAGVSPGRLAGANVPRCECGGIVRPDVVLYGEPLPGGVTEGAIREIAAADTLVIGGTSLAVYPAAGLIRYFQGDSLVLINLTPTTADASADLVIHQPIGETLAPFMH